MAQQQVPAGPYQAQQPMATVQMQLGGGSRNVLGKPVDGNGKREWSHGLCGCFDECGTCCLACWCPCIAYGKNTQRLNYLTDHGRPDPDAGGCCSGACCGYCILTHFGIHWILQFMGRGNTRGRYSIEGGGCGDCLTSWCCGPCDLVQVSREIKLEEESFTKPY
ncbi:PLAC8-domain-containing protein [Mycena sanguinolenta]|nr:PLAC8-domain-containing protein [Mycena sanguinolenta]